jgi:predicted nucleic acid-binding protein
VRRNGVAIETARRALALAQTLLDEAVPLAGLSERALDFAALHGVSAYDGTYLALAQERQLPLLTADERLLRLLTERVCHNWRGA